MPTSLKRSIQIKVTLTPELHERLRAVALQVGQAPATVASMAIGNYVRSMEVQAGAQMAAVDRMTQMLQPMLAEQLKLADAMSDGPAAPTTRDAATLPKRKARAKR